MPQVILELSAEERKLLQAYKEAVKADKSLRDSVDATGEAGKKAGKKIADGMIAGAKEAQKGVSAALNNGGLTKQAQKELREMIKILRTMGPEGRKAAQGLSRHLAIAGREGVESVDDVIKQIEKIDNAAGKSVRKARAEFGKLKGSQNQTVGEPGLKMVGAYAAKWVSVASAISLVADAMGRVRETNARALEALEGNKSGDKRLLQVSENAKDFQTLRNRADELAANEGIGRDEARDLMFSARSEGFESAAGFIAGNAQILDVAGQATVAGQIPGLFTKETLSPQQAINMTLAGASASRLDFGQIARSLPSAAEGGALAGASSDETVATLSVLAGRFKSGETAADRIKALATRVGMDEGGDADTPEEIARKQAAEDKRVTAAKRRQRSLIERRDDLAGDLDAARQGRASTPAQAAAKEKRIADLETSLARAQRGVDEFDSSSLTRREFKAGTARASLKGSGLIGAVEKIMAMSEGDRKDFLGDSQEVNAAYTIMVEELGAIRERQATIADARSATGTNASPIAIKRAAAAADPKLAAIKEKVRAANRREIAEENRRAVEEAKRVSARDRAFANAEVNGSSKLAIAGAGIINDASNFVGAGSVGNAFAEAALGSSLNDFEQGLAGSLSLDGGLGRGKIGDKDRPAIEALLLATGSLDRRRSQDPRAILSKQDVSSYLSRVTGGAVLPEQVTGAQQLALTEGVIESSNAYANDSYRSLGGRRDFNVGLSNDVARELTSTLKQLEVTMARQTPAIEATAENTKPGGTDPALILNAVSKQ